MSGNNPRRVPRTLAPIVKNPGVCHAAAEFYRHGGHPSRNPRAAPSDRHDGRSRRRRQCSWVVDCRATGSRAGLVGFTPRCRGIDCGRTQRRRARTRCGVDRSNDPHPQHRTPRDLAGVHHHMSTPTDRPCCRVSNHARHRSCRSADHCISRLLRYRPRRDTTRT